MSRWRYSWRPIRPTYGRGVTWRSYSPYRPTGASLTLAEQGPIPLTAPRYKTLAEAHAMPSIHHWATWAGKPGATIDVASAILGTPTMWPVTDPDGRYVVDFRAEWVEGGALTMRGTFTTLDAANLAALLWLQGIGGKRRRARTMARSSLRITDTGPRVTDPAPAPSPRLPSLVGAN